MTNKQTGLIDQSHSPINTVKDKVYQCYEDECKASGMTANEARTLAYQLSLAFQIAAEVDK